MLTATYALCYLALMALGVFFARPWLVAPPAAIRQFPRALRIAALILGCWAGSFVAANFANKIGYWISDGVTYDGNAEIPYEILHDGVGNNAWNLVFGWIIGFIAWGVAGVLFKKRTGHDGDGKPDPVSS